MKIGVYTNREKDKDFALTKRLLESLALTGVQLGLCVKGLEFNGAQPFTLEDMPHFDALVIFGGDGTLLRAAPYAARRGVSILGINLGYMGFLTEVESCEADLLAIARRLAGGEYNIERRSMLTVRGTKDDFFALNDVVIQRDPLQNTSKKTVSLTAFSDGMQIGHYNADGIIVSTPTGSTAYSLSAGGPILSPELSALVITAICPHSLSSRPIVIGDEHGVTVEVGKDGGSVSVITDGCSRFSLKGGGKVTIKKADCDAKFIRLSNSNFYARLKEKLNMWSIT